MRKIIFHILIYFLSQFNLRIVHGIGKIIGRIYFYFNKNALGLLKDNITKSGIYEEKDLENAILKNIDELGKGLLETFYIWGTNQKNLLQLVRNIYGQEEIEKAEKKGNGIIFLTPHLGCFEISSIAYGVDRPITIMYRKLRKKWMNDLMTKGRGKGLVSLATADTRGLKKILNALGRNEAIGILPDQVADKGQGENVDFFGRPAYTMVLVNKLISKTNASVFISYAERLKNGEGFDIYAEEIKKKDISTPSDLNLHLEKAIKKNPTQYYWSYNRFKKIRT